MNKAKGYKKKNTGEGYEEVLSRDDASRRAEALKNVGSRNHQAKATVKYKGDGKDKLTHYADLVKNLKKKVIDLEKKYKKEKSAFAVDESTLEFAMSPTPDRVSKATYERARSMLNMNTVMSRRVIRAQKIRLSDTTEINKSVTTDINVKNLTKNVNGILHNELSQSDNLDLKLYEILTKEGIDVANLEAGKDYGIIKVDEKYKQGADIAKNITFKEVTPELASEIAEVPGTNPNTTGIASSTGNMNLQTWKDADRIDDEAEREAKQKKVAAMIAANPELYEEFEEIANDPTAIATLESIMSKSQAWQIAKKNTQDSDQVKENWTRLYVEGHRAAKSAQSSGSLEAWEEFKRMLRNPDKYDTDKVEEVIERRIKEVLKK